VIVDFHVHLGSKKTWYQGTLALANQFAATNSLNELLEEDGDLKIESYLGYMDRLGIDCTVVISTYDTYEYVVEKCLNQPRFVPFYTLNPIYTPEPVKALEKAVEMGFKGLKLYPTYEQYYPNDPAVYPIYAKAQELGIPVMFHTGSSIFPGSRMKFGNPIFFDDIAVDFPELKLVMAHSGRGFWYDAAFFLSRLHRNLYMEISGLPSKKLLQLFPELERNAAKVIFGSDWPASPGPEAMIKDIRALSISEEAKELILGGNAARILGLA